MKKLVKVLETVWESWLRDFWMGTSMCGIFFGLTFIESNILIGAIITMGCGLNALAMDKGIY